MRKPLISLILITLLSACIGTGSNSAIQSKGEKYFPLMTGIDLLGEERVVPTSFAGKLNLVAVAFEREQQEDVNTWIPVAESLMQAHSHVKFYEIPLIYELNAVMRGWINNGMRAGIEDTIARERTITVYTDRAHFTSLMKMNTDSIYVLLLDEKGKILWSHQGIKNEKAVQHLTQYVKDYSNKT